MLDVIKEKLRPLFLRKYSVSRRAAERAASVAEMTPRERRLFLSGFEQGWMRGAVDATSLSSLDLHQEDRPEDRSDFH
jgi:hypothetical protein